jgi:hypothetical protein
VEEEGYLVEDHYHGYHRVYHQEWDGSKHLGQEKAHTWAQILEPKETQTRTQILETEDTRTQAQTLEPEEPQTHAQILE